MLAPLLVGLALVAVGLAVVHQVVVHSPLFEQGAEAWFPRHEGGLSTRDALARTLAGGAVPGVASVLAALLVATTPFRTWLWGVVGLTALTVVAAPLAHGYRLGCRAPTPEEAGRLADATDLLAVDVCVVDAARTGLVNGYTVGGPLADVVGVSRFAVETLPADALGALLAHEVSHHRRQHLLVRGAASTAWLAGGAAALTWRFETLTPAAAAGLVLLVVTERLLAHAVTRYTEYQADADGARRTSPAAMVALFERLAATTGPDRRTTTGPDRRTAAGPGASLHERLLSTHPTYEQRIARLRRTFDVEVGDSRPVAGAGGQ